MFNLPLTKRYIPAVAIIAVFVISTNILSHKMINTNTQNGEIINISGKQRMLSQKLVILASNFYNNPSITNTNILLKSLVEIEAAHKFLLTKVFTKELHEIYFRNKLDDNLKNYINIFPQLISTKDKKYLKEIRLKSNAILVQLNSAVKEYENNSKMQLKSLSDYEFYLMLGTLFMLVLEVVFIFRPAEKKINENTTSLTSKEEYEQTVIESNNNAIIAIDWTGKITTFNKKAEEIFGWTKSEMVGTRNLTNLIPKKYHDAHKNSSKKYLETGKSCGVINNTHELEGARKDGTIFPLQISFGAKWKPKNAIVVASIVDISKEKEQKNMLVQQSKMASMGEMIGNIAHQWRQPLSAISSTASGAILEKELGLLSDEELDLRLNNIVGKTQFLSQTIEDFRNFFKASKEKEDFEINRIIRNVENIVSANLINNSISVIKNYSKDTEVHCKGFGNELSQVILNILNNAKDVIVEKDSVDKIIKICLIQSGNNISIKIQDSAGGIPDEILPKIFEPYFTTKHQAQGTGIGLYMSSEIINCHFNGKLTAKNDKFTVNDKEYFGACFEINIPSGFINQERSSCES